MRLDVFLKLSRLVPRRGLAQEFCEAGLVSVNGSPAKASKDVKVADEIEVKRGDRIMKVRVAAIPKTKNVAKRSAPELYTLLEELPVEIDLL